MTARTLIINGDPTWPFGDYLWAHALDLYPPASGVGFLTTSTSPDEDQSYRVILGNFPENYGADTDALADEIAEEVMALDLGRVESLAIAGIVSAADFEVLANDAPGEHRPRLGKAATPRADLSASGAATVKALRAAMDRIGAMSGDDGRMAPQSRKLWLSLIVRDLGFEPAHAAAASRVAARLTGRNAGIRSVFFLSNGRGQDRNVRDPHLHFVKLRLLADILQAGATTDVGAALRADRPGTASAHWVRLPPGTDPYLDHSALLLASLIDAYDSVGQGVDDNAGATARQRFDARAAELEAEIPGPLGVTAAEEDLRGRLRAFAPGPGDPASYASQGLEDLVGAYDRPGRAGRLYAPSRVSRIEADARDFEIGLRALTDALDARTEDALNEARATHDGRRRLVTAALDALPRPPTSRPVVEFLGRMREKAAAFTGAIEGALAATTALDPDAAAAARAERTGLRDRLLAAERGLVNVPGLFKVPLLLVVLVFTPVAINVVARVIAGLAPADQVQLVWTNIWLLTLILAVVVILSLVVGWLRAGVMVRRRNRALAGLGAAMRGATSATFRRHAGQLSRGQDRRRLGLVRMVISRLDLDDPVSVANDSDRLIKSLRTVAGHLPPARSFGREMASVATPALDGFASAILRPDKVTGFLKSIGRPPETTLTVVLPGVERRLTLPTRTSPAPPEVHVRRPGDE